MFQFNNWKSLLFAFLKFYYRVIKLSLIYKKLLVFKYFLNGWLNDKNKQAIYELSLE